MNKKFPAVWMRNYPHYNSMEAIEFLNQSESYKSLNYQSIDELKHIIFNTNDIPDLSEHYLFFESSDTKIYIFKFNKEEPENLIKVFLLQVTKNNKEDKKIIFINPTETCADNFKHYYSDPNFTFTFPDRWQGLATYLYAKSMYDGVIDINPIKFDKILKQNYRPFKICYLVRRGNNRRLEFFDKMISFKNPNFLITYFNATLVAKGFNDETESLNFNDRNDISFPFSSHEVLQPNKWYHAQNDGADFMFQNICLLSMSEFNLVIESNQFHGAITEKSLYPFITKTIPILTSGIEHIKILENLGFHTFVDELGIRPTTDEYYSNTSHNENHFDKYFNLLDRINNGELDNFYKHNIDKIEENYKLAISIQKLEWLK